MSDSMITPEQAQNIVLEHISPVGIERVGLLESRGRLLARDIFPKRNNPSHNNSAMDGFAVRYQDVQNAQLDKAVKLEIIFKLRMSPAPLKKPAAFEKVGAAVIAEAANTPRINLLEKSLFSVFSKINCLLTN